LAGGPAGMMAAIKAAEDKTNDVVLIEKNKTLGKKLLITGKGRCNITNNAEMSEFLSSVPCNGKFLYSAFNNYTNTDIVEFLNKQGVKTKVERGKRVFPVSDKASDVLNAFLKRMKELGVTIKTECEAKEIIVEEDQIVGVVLNGEQGIKGDNSNSGYIKADKVILATGGLSYPGTGSTGDGYKMAERIGHNIVPTKPSLVPLMISNSELWLCKESQGLSLKNVKVSIKDVLDEVEDKTNGDVRHKIIFEEFGEMLFTHLGVSGPVILSGAAYMRGYKGIENKLREGRVKLHIDLKPALSVEQLDMRVRRDFEEVSNKQFKNSLNKLLPQNLIAPIIKLSKIDSEKKVNTITREERLGLVKLIKGLKLTVADFGKIHEAIITSGGVDVKEINPKTMESKLVKGMYFAGEIIDVDALTGGFNLQIAYSTRICCRNEVNPVIQ